MYFFFSLASYLQDKQTIIFMLIYSSSGQFAVVKRVRELNTGEEFAAKFVRKKKCIAGKRGLKREEILREAEILSELAPHPNIINLHDVFENKHEIILVLELYVQISP